MKLGLAAVSVMVALAATPATAAPVYDLLLRGARVIDAKNDLDGKRDIAIADHKIAAVAPRIDPATAYKVIDVSGFVVTPGLIDIHAHFLAPSLGRLLPDSHTLRSCVTTVVDAGGAGWRDLPRMKAEVIDKATTRVLAFLNIVGAGIATREQQQDVADMDPAKAADMIKRFPGVVVGVKTAHYDGPEWIAVDRALAAGKLAGVPVMVDFGKFRPERPFEELVSKRLRPGDIYTHTYLADVPLLDERGRIRPYLLEAQKRGVLFDAGHGQGSFLWRQAEPAVKQGFVADTISTDLHGGSMNAGMKDMVNVMSKFLALGRSLPDVIKRSTWIPARAIRREELGHLSVGAVADVAVLRVDKGRVAFVDSYKARRDGSQRLECEMLIKDGLVEFERNGLARAAWDKLPKGYKSQGDKRWDGTRED